MGSTSLYWDLYCENLLQMQVKPAVGAVPKGLNDPRDKHLVERQTTKCIRYIRLTKFILHLNEFAMVVASGNGRDGLEIHSFG